MKVKQRLLSLGVFLSLAACTSFNVTPVKLMGPTYEQGWQLWDKTNWGCPIPEQQEKSFYQLKVEAERNGRLVI